MNAINNEFKEIYAGLNKFLKYNRNELARVEMRLERVEQNVNLLTWQNSIEYQEYEGEEYRDMDATKKIVCLTRDFYEITKGKWSTSDLLLLKTAMSTIDIQPGDQVNYYGVLREISRNKNLKNKLLGNADICPIEDPSYLISMGTMEKLDALEQREAYIVDTVMGYMNQNNIQAKREDVCDSLTYNYLKERADVNLDMNVDSYDLILDLLYNIKQAEADNLLMMPVGEQKKKLQEAEQLYLHCKLEESLPIFKMLADEGNARAMYFLGELYTWALPKDRQNKELATSWRRKGAELGDVLCRLNMAYIPGTSDEQKKSIFTSIEPELKNLANEGDVFAQSELGSVCKFLNDESAMDWYKKSASQGYYLPMNNLGNEYSNQGDYEEANKWHKLAGEAGYDWGWHNLANAYRNGNGVEKDEDKAIELYKKAYDMSGNAAGSSANALGNIYYNRGNYEEANKWYTISGEAGFDWGWNNLANDYLWGCGFSKDVDKARYYYEKAFELNGEAKGNAAYQIATIYNDKCEYDEARKWYRIAADAGNEDARKALGNY